jgi:hypothetical protein
MDSFEDALSELLTKYRDTDRDELIRALELAIMSLNEDRDPDE